MQGTLCRAARDLFGAECAVSGCSRTDSGVHARDFAATLETDSATVIPDEKLPRALMAHLPPEITVYSAKSVDPSYSVRRHVADKEYEYVILNSPSPSPFLTGRAWHIPFLLDEAAMNEAAAAFVGKHDFSAFMASGSGVKNTERTVSLCKVTRDGDLLKINVAADGFLYNMVRIIVGTLVEVGAGKLGAGKIGEIISGRKRSDAGRTAPPDGLYLLRVDLK